MNQKVDFYKVSTAANSLYEARSHLNDEVINDLERLLKKLDAITEGSDDENGDNLFDIADDLESDIMNAQEHLEKVYEVLAAIIRC